MLCICRNFYLIMHQTDSGFGTRSFASFEAVTSTVVVFTELSVELGERVGR